MLSRQVLGFSIVVIEIVQLNLLIESFSNALPMFYSNCLMIGGSIVPVVPIQVLVM